MPDSLVPYVAGLALVLLGVLVVLAALALARLGSAAGDREATGRELAALRTDLAVVKAQGEDLERDLKQDLAFARTDHQTAAQGLRTEVGERFAQVASTTQHQLGAVAQATGEQLKAFGDRLEQFTRLMQQQLKDGGEAQVVQARVADERLQALTLASEQRLEGVRQAVEQRLDALRSENAQKLEQMRATVDEKLQTTLETRLGESFKLVSERLEQVHRGLGEMQNLATGVGDLKRALTNVKTRGTWGEVQLGALLADVLTPAQYAQNVATRPGSSDRVEYAIRFPGRGDDGEPCWLPIDAKFPLDDWQRLQDAAEAADAAGVETSRRALEQFFKQQARDIRDKYVEPPYTTDFAVLFVPTEGLFAEAVARPGLFESLQREFRVTLAGPTNLCAMLNSLQLGFRTLAIEQRSTEVWRVLGAVKTEFGKFGEILARTKDKLDQVGRTLDEAGRKSTTIARKLRDVEALPVEDADRLLTGEVARLVDAEPAADAVVAPLPLGPRRSDAA